MAPLVVEDAAVVRGDHADALGRVHRAAAADRDEPVTALRLVFGGACIDKVDGRVCLHAIEHDRLHVGAAQRLERGVEQARGLDSWICHQQRPADAEQGCFATQLADRAEALHQPGRALVGAECVLEHLLLVEAAAGRSAPGGHGFAIQPESRGGCGKGRCPGAAG